MDIFHGTTAFGATAVSTEENELLLTFGGGVRRFALPGETNDPIPAPFAGYTEEEIVASGRDLLAEKLLADGEPSREKMRGMLPPVGGCGFSLLGAEASWSGFTVRRSGEIWLQTTGGKNDTARLFCPTEFDETLGAVLPCAAYLDGDLPVLCSLFAQDGRKMLLLQFCEPQDPDRNPVLWTFCALNGNGESSFRYQRSSYSREKTVLPIDGETYWENFLAAVTYWEKELASLAAFDLPDAKLPGEIRAMFSTAFTTFAGDHPHYGHYFYGQETHDYFPPTFLSYVETMLLYGNVGRARRTLEQILCHGFDPLGRLAYRQGEEEVHGVSASEYGEFFRLLEFADAFPRMRDVIDDYLPIIKKSGKLLIEKIRTCDAYPDLSLISMCAEADTNSRVHVYTQNNLWASKGLSALGTLLSRRNDPDAETFTTAAENLRSDMLKLLEREAVESRFGRLIPFRSGYTPLPYTLSGCRETSVPMTDDAYRAYAENVSWCRTDFNAATGQDFLENCYANYRYYPEMLSSGLLPAEYETAIAVMRRQLGGEILGMTRFMRDGIDDWPVIHIADYLLRSGEKDRYLMLLYAHLLFHGETGTGVYYEQRNIPGNWTAPDCVPSLLTVPLMLAKAFVCEEDGGEVINLLSAVPDAWMRRGFAVSGLCTRYGAVSVTARRVNEHTRVEITLPEIPEGVRIRVFRPGTPRKFETVPARQTTFVCHF